MRTFSEVTSLFFKAIRYKNLEDINVPMEN